MRQYIPVITLALLGAFALAVVSGGLLPSDNAVRAEHIDAPTNTAPVFSDSDGREIPENTPAGVNIGAPVSATDVDEDTLTYSLDDDSSATFDIDSSTGQLITKAALNHEPDEPTRYSVTVTVNDGTEDDANNNASRTLTITVTDEAEEPAQPAPPVVTTGSAAASLEINWFPPENTGPDINDYDYRYKMTTETSWMVVENGTSTDTTATISPLEADTAYQVSVRAGSVEGDGPWSFAATGSTNKEGNAAPVFPDTEAGERSVLENTPPRQRVGAAVTATDANSTTLNYSLAGEDADSFDIEESTGQVMTKAALNHEAKGSYTVFVVVDDDGDGGSDVITVTITVTDASERPSQPAAPTVERVEDVTETPDDESTMNLKVSWTAPDTEGPPINGYDIEYRKGMSGAFEDDDCGQSGSDNCQGLSGTETTITGLDANSSYQVRVTANSVEQNSLPSPTKAGSTMPSNNPPVFSTETLTRNVAENTPAGRNIGSAIRATDSDRGDTLTYSLVPDSGAECDGDSADDVCAFDINPSTGQLKTKDTLDHESEDEYSVTVTATDRKRVSDTIEVTITINDVDEPPLAPSTPTVSVNTGSPTDTLDVSWAAPGNEGRPDITEYEVQYRASGSWTSLNHDSTDTMATIPDLNPFTNYHVQVRAINDEGESPWVSSSEFTNTVDNNLPQFTGSTDRSVEENTPRGQPVGLPVEASDADSDNLTHSLGGVHANLFSIDSSDGLIRVKESLNFEAECGDDSDHETRCTYNVDVKAVDGKGGSATAAVTITVTDVTTEAPSAPSAPTVRAAVATEDEPNLDPTTMLEVSWDEPQNDGPSITAFAVQYKVSGVSDENFVSENIQVDDDDATNTSVIITGLEDNTTYQVQVMATNLEGSSVWSRVGSGKTRFANTRPEFSRDSYDLTVKENTPSGRSIGRPVAATDDDGHTLTYTLEGVHKDEFTIERGSGHIRTRASLDYESMSGYSLTVRATDTEGGSAAVSVAIMVEDDTNEAPTRLGAPAVSAIAGSTSSVRVSWDAPSNEGRPPIVDYDVQYRTGGGVFIPWPHDESTDTSTIITGLSAGTSYEVQVKAWNISEDSEWSPSGRGSPDADPANNAPTFSGGPRTFSVAENTAAGENIGAPVTATDTDRDSLAYSLEGTDAASFYIDPATGQIQTSAPLNHEEKASHSVTVKADDARGGMATVSVTINVTDVPGEAPEKPDTPTVVAASSTSLAVNWVAPDNPGPPITDYDYRYKEPTAAGWTEVTDTAITQTNAIVSPLRPDTSYEVQVRAKNAEANGEWSDSGTGSTNAGGANNPPVFTEGVSTTRTVIPNAQAGEHVGGPVTATDADQGDTVTYSLEGAGAASFAIEPQTGQITVRVALSNAQVGDTYTVEVVASDGTAEARITVTITVTAVSNVLPSVPDAPTVSPNAASATSLDVSWIAPDNQGPPITDYDYRYRTVGAAFWRVIDGTSITDTSVTIEDLTTGTEYEVQVRATNAGGTTDWSASGAGTPVNPGANNPPEFSSATTTRAVAENTPAGTYIADPVSANDADPNDTLTYSLSGQDASSFNIDDETGQLMTRVPLDYEVKRSYSVTVTASDGRDSDEIQVTVAVIDMDEPPSAPSLPRVMATSSSTTSLDVSWDEPLNTGPAITDYDIQYRVGSAGSFTDWPHSGTDRTTTITALSEGTSYDVQVLAKNDEGIGPWSESGTGSTSINSPPEFSSVRTTRSVDENTPAGTDIDDPVSATDDDPDDTLTYSLSGTDASSFNIDGTTGQLMTSAALDYEMRRSYMVTVTASDGTDTAEIQVTVSVTDMYPRCTTQEVGNRGLTNDCESLLESRAILEGTNGSRLNWSDRRPMAQWEGVNLRGTPRRVTRLDLMDVGLHGTIPTSLSRLSELTHLNLRSNPDLTGEVPGELGNLSKLRLLNLHSNSHTGGVPDLRNATLLEELYLANNADYNADGSKVAGSGLTGRIPTWLNGMTNMRELWLWGNSLSGTVPNLSGMTSLDKLKLANNNLTGGIPQASTLPPNMTWLIIDRNPFRGTIPNLSSLSRLRLLWLHSSRLTGTVPAGNNYPASLDDLNLRDNMLTGTIPDLSNLDNLTRLRLHNNSLSGEVPATLGGLDSLKQLWLHNEDATKTSNGNNAFTSIAAGVGGLADTLIEIALDGNPWANDACVPVALASVAKNDYTEAGIEVCSANGGS